MLRRGFSLAVFGIAALGVAAGCNGKGGDPTATAGESATDSHSTTTGAQTGTDSSGAETGTSGTETGTSGTETSGAETGDTDTGTDTDTDTGGDMYTGECSIAVVDHSESCADCPIVNDLRIRCDDREFGAPGLRVAPAPDSDAIYVVTASSDYAWFGALTPDGGGALEELPELFDRKVLYLAQDPGGSPFIATDQTQVADDYAGGVVLYDALLGDEELVFDNPNKYSPLIDVEFDSTGRAHLWIVTDAPDERTEFIRGPGPDGTWSSTPAPVPGTTGWQRYGLTADGAPVAFDFAENPANTYRLFADEGMGAYAISTSFGAQYPGAYAHTVPPALPTLESAGPRYLVYSAHDTGFRVAAPTQDGFDELMIKTPGLVKFTCLDGYDGEPGSCPDTCDEVSEGIYASQVAVARTQDGRVWAAYGLTHVDQTRVFTESCDEEVGCWCNVDVTRDDSWGEIVLLRVDVGAGEAVEVMRVDTLDVELRNAFIDFRESPKTFDMRAFGDALAIGVRVRHLGESLVPDMRLLRIDTAQLP
jgi:hypothetical protein